MRSPGLLVSTVLVVLLAAPSLPAAAQEAQEAAAARAAKAADHLRLLKSCRPVVNEMAAAERLQAQWDSLMPEVSREQAWIEENRGLEVRDPIRYAIHLEKYDKGLEGLVALKKDLQWAVSKIQGQRTLMVPGFYERCIKLEATREELTAVCGGSQDAFCSAFRQ
jgi:hypothetical protein